MCLWLIHVDGWQKPTQLCKAIILQLKNKFKIKKKNQTKRKSPEMFGISQHHTDLVVVIKLPIRLGFS